MVSKPFACVIIIGIIMIFRVIFIVPIIYGWAIFVG